MKKETIVQYTSETMPPDRSDYELINRLTEQDIIDAVASDPDAAPFLNWENPYRWQPSDGPFIDFVKAIEAGHYKAVKQPVTLRLDSDILASLKRMGKGYQTRINQVLREYVMQHDPAFHSPQG